MKRRIMLLLSVAMFATTPLFWQLDLSKANLDYYDSLAMAPYSALHAAVFLTSVLALLYNDEGKQYSLLGILLLSLYHPIIVFSNYPFLTFRDVYLHGAPMKVILADGHLGFKRNPVSDYWPSTSVFHALSAIVLNCDDIMASYVLYIVLVIVSSLASYCLARTLMKRGYGLAWVCPILLLALLRNHVTKFDSYSRAFFGLVLLFMFIYSYVRLEDRRGALVRLLLIASLGITHPFSSLYAVFFCFAYVVLCMLSMRAPPPPGVARWHSAFLSAVFFIGWWMFQAGSSIEGAIQYARLALTSEIPGPLLTALLVREPLPIWGVSLRTYYKYSLLALLLATAFGSLIVLVRRRGNLSKSLLAVLCLMSTSVVSFLFVPVLMLLPAWSLDRATAYLAFPAAFSSLVIFSYIKGDRQAGFGKRAMKALKAVMFIFVLFLSFSTTMLQFEGNHYYEQLTHPAELYSLSFLFSHNEGAKIAMARETSVYAEYFDYRYESSFLVYVGSETSEGYGRTHDQTILDSSLRESIAFSEFAVEGIRDHVMVPKPYDPFREVSSELRTELHKEVITPRFSEIYSNGYFSIYLRNRTNIAQ